MGCSPSKGQLFPGVAGPHRALPSATEEDHLRLMSGEEERHCLGTHEGANILPLAAKEEPLIPIEAPDVASGTAIVSTSRGSTEIEVNLKSEGRDTQLERLAIGMQMKKVEKRRKIKGPKQGRRREKERKSSIAHTKVDLPVHMVKAHQAAYAYLNPNISKYETLLGLLDQATQTQLSLQPMMTAIVMRFEEVNQALEEMADEGEQMLTEHGNHMAWPSGKRPLPPVPTKPTANPSDPPPDLLQQMLQHSTEKMRLVGSSVQGLGDVALEEAVEYFDSLSKLLGERLQAKRAAEGRLTQVLARVEAAARRKSSPEDSALHSEDSGIGGENESLPGSDRHRHHRGSSGGNSRTTPQCPPDKCEEEEEEEEEEDDDYEDEEEEEDEVERLGRKRSNSSPPDPSQPFLPSPPQQGHNQLPRRPRTAAPSARSARLQRSQSTDCAHAILELQKSQRDLDQRMKKMADRTEGGTNYALYRVGLRRHSSGSGVRHALKGYHKGNQSSNQLPALVPHPPGRNSVRRLINTFSNGVDGRPGQSLANIPPNIRGPRKSATPFLPSIGMGERSLVNGNNNNNGWAAETREDVDVDSLPPPPLEVLMDNSFQSTEENTGDDEEEERKAGRPPRQRSSASQRLRASMQNVTVLPNRGTVRRSSLSMSPARPVRQDAVVGGQGLELLPNEEQDLEKEQAASLYRQARKIIHLRNAAESPVRAAERGLRGPSPLRAGERQGSDDYCEEEAYSSAPPPTTPPVSRVRLPPSCPSVHYRIPSPPVYKNQPTSSFQMSRPPSPRVLTWAKDNSCEEKTSMSFYDARSVFTQNRQTPSDTSTLPRPWGESTRGRLPTRETQTARRTQSDRRPSLTKGTGPC